MVIVAAAAMVGCSPLLPTAAPTSVATLRLYSTDATLPLLRALTHTYVQSHPNILFETPSSNHATLLRDLLAGSITYFVTSELPVVPNQTIWAAPLAQVGLAVVVSRLNPVTRVSLDDLRQLYLGAVLDWRELGGLPASVVLYSREEGADTRTQFERLVMGNRRTSPNARVVSSAATALSSLRETAGGIAYLPLSQLSSDVKVLAVEGILPDDSTLRDNRYPLRSTVYIVGLTEPDGGLHDVIHWIQSSVGQAALPYGTAPLPR